MQVCAGSYFHLDASQHLVVLPSTPVPTHHRLHAAQCPPTEPASRWDDPIHPIEPSLTVTIPKILAKAKAKEKGVRSETESSGSASTGGPVHAVSAQLAHIQRQEQHLQLMPHGFDGAICFPKRPAGVFVFSFEPTPLNDSLVQFRD